MAVTINVASASPITEKTNKAVREVMESAMQDSDLPAVVAVAVNSNGQLVEYSYGNVNWSETLPVSTDSIFRIHSMTKIVTSIAAMQLVEQGEVHLDQDLSELLPEMARIPIMLPYSELVEALINSYGRL